MFMQILRGFIPLDWLLNDATSKYVDLDAIFLQSCFHIFMKSLLFVSNTLFVKQRCVCVCVKKIVLEMMEFVAEILNEIWLFHDNIIVWLFINGHHESDVSSKHQKLYQNNQKQNH